MKIPFDKIYVISYIKNINKQHEIKTYLNKIWNVDFDFIYGIDVIGLENIFNLNKIHFYGNNPNLQDYDKGHISCGIAHYTAIEHAYVNNYNSCLIIEDDTCFIDDLKYIEYCFNHTPKDADSCRFALTNRNIDIIDKYNDFWILNESFIGAQCYSINNRLMMKQYIQCMNDFFREADDYTFFENKKVYQLKRLIGYDPYSILNFYKINDLQNITLNGVAPQRIGIDLSEYNMDEVISFRIIINDNKFIECSRTDNIVIFNIDPLKLNGISGKYDITNENWNHLFSGNWNINIV